MPERWHKLKNNDVVIAHLSDPHVGSPGWESPWRSVANFLGEVQPSLIVVSGDLVHSPEDELYKTAKRELDALRVKYYVCAGNHDRHWYGNRPPSMLARIPFLGRRFKPSGGNAQGVATLFDNVFQGHVLAVGSSQQPPLSMPGNSWKIGFLGIDSSQNADCSARGWIHYNEMYPLPKQTTGQEWDLCIFVVHHHLLSIRKLEQQRQGKLADLLKLTCLVNAGIVLEDLANSRVDLVLHGHEHEANWATYGSLAPGRGQVHVISAGSATGNNSTSGGDVSRASFNLIVLSEDRSGRLFQMKFDGARWDVNANAIPLFDATDVRHSWMRRRHADALDGTRVRSRVTKHVEFTRERDLWVRWVLSDWQLEDGQFEQEIYGGSGVLDEKSVRVHLSSEDQPIAIAEVRAVKTRSAARRRIQFSVPDAHKGKPLNIEIDYKWRGAATLTLEELDQLLARGAGDPIRERRLEFASLKVARPVRTAELIIGIPIEYAPDSVEVLVQEGQEDRELESAELQRDLCELAPGRYALRIEFPRTNRQYRVTWTPPSGQRALLLADYVGFGAVAGKSGEKLLTVFAASIANTSLQGNCTLTLYATRHDGPPTAKIVASIRLPATASYVLPDEPIYPGNRSAVGRAWAGEATRVWKRPDLPKDAENVGFIGGETAILTLPIRFDWDWNNPFPWGIVRIGVWNGAGKEFHDESGKAKLWRTLAKASMDLLSAALTEVNDNDRST